MPGATLLDPVAATERPRAPRYAHAETDAFLQRQLNELQSCLDDTSDTERKEFLSDQLERTRSHLGVRLLLNDPEFHEEMARVLTELRNGALSERALTVEEFDLLIRS
jgi:hypothetical protein